MLYIDFIFTGTGCLFFGFLINKFINKTINDSKKIILLEKNIIMLKKNIVELENIIINLEFNYNNNMILFKKKLKDKINFLQDIICSYKNLNR